MKTSRFTVYLNNNREFHRHYLDLVSEWGGARERGEEFVSLSTCNCAFQTHHNNMGGLI